MSASASTASFQADLGEVAVPQASGLLKDALLPDYESWSTPDDFEWDSPTEVPDESDVYRGLRALMEDGDDPVELLEAATHSNWGNGARRRISGKLWANIDLQQAPDLVTDGGEGVITEGHQRLVRSPLRSHRKRGQRQLRAWDLIPHGTRSSYTNLCRPHPDGPCDACRQANAAYARDRYRRTKENQ